MKHSCKTCGKEVTLSFFGIYASYCSDKCAIEGQKKSYKLWKTKYLTNKVNYLVTFTHSEQIQVGQAEWNKHTYISLLENSEFTCLFKTLKQAKKAVSKSGKKYTIQKLYVRKTYED